MRIQRVLLTGASGLLGNAILSHIHGRIDVVPVSHSRECPGMLKGDLGEPEFQKRLADEAWDAVVHCAAIRSPDLCDSQPALAERLNAQVPVELARLARQRGARMIHVSTDYVFDGTRPPYREEDACHPINLYGQTKRRAEEGIAAVFPAAVIMRIGALYGVPRPGIPSPMLQEAIQVVCAGKPAEVDHRIKRYPLLVDDVAQVVGFLLANEGISGVVHVGASLSATRYEWALAVAGVLQRDVSHLSPSNRDLTRSAVRPVDTGMSTTRLRALGGPVPRDYPEVLAGVVKQSRQECDAQKGVVRQ